MRRATFALTSALFALSTPACSPPEPPPSVAAASPPPAPEPAPTSTPAPTPAASAEPSPPPAPPPSAAPEVVFGAGSLDTGFGGRGGLVRDGGSDAAPAVSHGGLTPEQVRRVVLAHAGALRACYETEVQRDPNVKGVADVAWTITPNGSVEGATVTGGSLGSPRLESCVVRQVSSWRFPTSDTKTEIVRYPFRFGVDAPRP
jgi:hypothetical protein